MSSRCLCEVLVPIRDSTEEQSLGRPECGYWWSGHALVAAWEDVKAVPEPGQQRWQLLWR